MNNNKIIYILFGILVIAQLYVPISMIWDKENTLKTGVEYKFKTRPVDPYDPFVGRYVTLSFDMEEFETDESYKYSRNDEIYVYLDNDSEGYACIKAVDKTPGKYDYDYVKATVVYYYDGELNIKFPFDRYYMNENMAKPAENAYEKASRWDSYLPVYALVSVKNGKSVLKGIYVGDMTIEEYVTKLENEKETDDRDGLIIEEEELNGYVPVLEEAIEEEE